jgi:hypothetical protein
MTTSDGAWLTAAQRIVAGSLPSRAEAQLRYAIAKYFDDTRDFEQAWLNYHQANEVAKHHTPKYDRQHQSRATELIRSLDRQWLSQAQVDAHATVRPVFVVGMPRSGTTLTEQILASHPAVFGAGELRFWSKAGAAYHSAAGNAQVSRSTPAKMASEYLQLHETLPTDASRIVDKMPTNFMHLGLINAGLLNARIIHIQRNPIDTCLSIYFQNFNHTHPYAIDLEYLTHFYGEYKQVMDHWRSTLPPGVLLEISYEQLIDDQEILSRKMIEFIGLEWDPRCLDFHQTDRAVITASRWQVKQKINKSSVARWRNYEQYVEALLPLLS